MKFYIYSYHAHEKLINPFQSNETTWNYQSLTKWPASLGTDRRKLRSRGKWLTWGHISSQLWSQILTWCWCFTPALSVFYRQLEPSQMVEWICDIFNFKKVWIILYLRRRNKSYQNKTQKPTCVPLHLWHPIKGQGKFCAIVRQLLLLWQYFQTPFSHILLSTTTSIIYGKQLTDHKRVPRKFQHNLRILLNTVLQTINTN